MEQEKRNYSFRNNCFFKFPQLYDHFKSQKPYVIKTRIKISEIKIDARGGKL